MNAFHAVLRAMMAAVLAPFASLPPVAPLLVISLLSGIVAAIVFRYTSNQTALKRVADQLSANILALRLYKDDTVVTFRAIGGMLVASGLRMFYSLAPMAVMLIPFVLLVAQMAMYYEFRPLHAGDTAYIVVDVRAGNWKEYRNLQLDAPPDVVIQAVHRDDEGHRLVFRVAPRTEVGQVNLALKLNGLEVATKQFVVSNDDSKLAFVSPMRASSNFLERVLYPGEDAFGGTSPIQKIAIHEYPPRSTPILGYDLHWIMTFLIVSIVGALAVSPWMKVQF